MYMVMDEQRKECQEKRRKAKQRIQELYEIVSKNFDGESEQWLLMVDELEKYSEAAIWAVLAKSPFASSMAVDEINGIVREALYGEKVFKGYRKMLEKNPNCMFSDYCRGIYRHKALDYIDRRFKVEIPWNGDSRFGNSGNRRRSGSGKWVNVAPAGTEISDGTLDVWERFIKCYLDAGLESNTNPFHVIFWCYSKILSVILMQTSCSSADTWAWKQMRDLSMAELSDKFMRVYNSTMRTLRMQWSRQYEENLEKPYENRHGEMVTVAQVILTDEYTMENAKNWVARMHERTMKKVVKTICQNHDEELIQMAMTHTCNKYGI